MQTSFNFQQAADLRSIRDRLSLQFGKIMDRERLDPVSQFVRYFLGSRTLEHVSWSAFARLITHYQSWDAVADAPVADIEALIRDVTFPEKKAPELKAALRKIRACSPNFSDV